MACLDDNITQYVYGACLNGREVEQMKALTMTR
jgi:hypothetical protein